MIKDNNVLKCNYNMLGQSNKVWSTHMEHRLMKLDEYYLLDKMNFLRCLFTNEGNHFFNSLDVIIKCMICVTFFRLIHMTDQKAIMTTNLLARKQICLETGANPIFNYSARLGVSQG